MTTQTNTNQLLSILKGLDEHIGVLLEELHLSKSDVEKVGKRLAEELTKIPGWENMVQDCLEHYKEYPKDFLGWCSYEVWDGKLTVIKGYSNDNDYIFLEIDLTKSLEDQVKEVVEKRKSEEEEMSNKKLLKLYEKDMESLRHMKMETISFDEWKNQIKKQ